MKGIACKQHVNHEIYNADQIPEIIQNLNWNTFNIVSLSRNIEERIEIGGSLGPDGFACVYIEKLKHNVVDIQIVSAEDVAHVLHAYFKAGKNLISDDSFALEKNSFKKRKDDLQKRADWKVQYEISQRLERVSKFKTWTIVLLGLVVGLLLFNLLHTNELQFLRFKTDYSVATVSDIKRQHLGRGKYMQIATYTFQYGGETYTEFFYAGNSMGKQEIGNRVKVKFAVKYPNRSKKVGNLVNKK